MATDINEVYKMFPCAKSRDQAKELLICKRCGFLLVPSSLEPRKQYIHEEKNNVI